MKSEFGQIEASVGKVTIRSYEERDIPHQIAYIYDSPIQFLEEVGFDVKTYPPKEEMIKRLKSRMENEKNCHRPSVIVAELNGQAIAMVFLDLSKKNPETPRLHFHILKEAYRGKGLGSPILKASIDALGKTHKFNRFLIEPKISNSRMNHLMKKLGFRYLKDVVHEAEPTTQKMHASQYEVICKFTEA